MLTEVHHRRLDAVEDIRSLDDIWNHVKYAWKQADVTGTNFPFSNQASAVMSHSFRLDHAMHSLEIEQVLATHKMCALTNYWFAHYLLFHEDLLEHSVLVGLGCVHTEVQRIPRVLFTEPFFHQEIQSRFGVHLRRYDYTWPAGTLVPAMPLSPEAT